MIVYSKDANIDGSVFETLACRTKADAVDARMLCRFVAASAALQSLCSHGYMRVNLPAPYSSIISPLRFALLMNLRALLSGHFWFHVNS